jgi:hypothetical protein
MVTKEQKHAEYQRNKERYRTTRQAYYQKHKAEYIKKAQGRYKQNKNNPAFMAKRRKSTKEHYQKNRKKYLSWHQKRLERLKMEVISHYTQGTLKCKCGFSDIRALTIDHINGGGSKERKNFRGEQFLRKIIKEGFPSIYQVLCMNCQFIKAHEKKEF